YVRVERTAATKNPSAPPWERSGNGDSGIRLAGARGGTAGRGGGGRRGGPRGRARLGGLRARARARLHREAALERRIDALLHGDGRLAHHFGDFGDDQELRAIEHALFAERQALGPAEEREALEAVGDVVDRPAAHLVGVVLEAPLPVLVVVDLAVAEQREEALDFLVTDRAAEPHAIHVGDRHEHGR